MADSLNSSAGCQSIEYDVEACVVDMLATIEGDCCNAASKAHPRVEKSLQLYGSKFGPASSLNAKFGTTLDNLFNLTSDLPLLFGPPFLPDCIPPDFSRKFKAAYFSFDQNRKNNSTEIIDIYRRLVHFWMRLECIDPFDLAEPFGDSIDYSGAAEVRAAELEALAMVETVFEKIPSATDRLIARHLLAAVAKTSSCVLRKLILEQGGGHLKQCLMRQYRQTLCEYELLLSGIFAEEGNRLLSDWNQFHGFKKAPCQWGAPYTQLEMFDRVSVAYTLCQVEKFLSDKRAHQQSRDLIQNLEADPELTRVALYSRLKRKREKLMMLRDESAFGPHVRTTLSPLYFSDQAVAAKPTCSASQEHLSRLPPVPPYHVVKFVRRLPAKIINNLTDRISEFVTDHVALYLPQCQPKRIGYPSLLKVIVAEQTETCEGDLRQCLHAFLSLPMPDRVKKLIRPLQCCEDGFICRAMISSRAGCDPKKLSLISQTVLHLARFLDRLFRNPREGPRPTDFPAFCFLLGVLVSHLYLLIRPNPSERGCVKILIRKVHDILSNCMEIAQNQPGISVIWFGYHVNKPVVSVHQALTLASRTVVRFSYILSLSSALSSSGETMSFGMLPADRLFSYLEGHVDRALQNALALQTRSSVSSTAEQTHAVVLLHSIALRKRIALDVTLSMFLLENAVTYVTVIGQCSTALAKRLAISLQALHSLLALTESHEVEGQKDLVEMSRILKKTELNVLLVLSQLSVNVPTLEAFDLEEVFASAGENLENQLRELRKCASNCLQNGDPVWRFFLQDFFRLGFQQNAVYPEAWFREASSLELSFFQSISSVSKVCHLAGVVLALKGGGLPCDRTNDVPKRAGIRIDLKAGVESPLIATTKMMLSTSSYCSEVLEVLIFHANWLLYRGIQNWMRKRLVNVLSNFGATSPFENWMILYLEKIEASLRSTEAECSSNFAMFVEICKNYNSNTLLEPGMLLDLGWTSYKPKEPEAPASSSTQGFKMAVGQSVSGPSAKKSELSANEERADENSVDKNRVSPVVESIATSTATTSWAETPTSSSSKTEPVKTQNRTTEEVCSAADVFDRSTSTVSSGMKQSETGADLLGPTAANCLPKCPLGVARSALDARERVMRWVRNNIVPKSAIVCPTSNSAAKEPAPPSAKPVGRLQQLPTVNLATPYLSPSPTTSVGQVPNEASTLTPGLRLTSQSILRPLTPAPPNTTFSVNAPDGGSLPKRLPAAPFAKTYAQQLMPYSYLPPPPVASYGILPTMSQGHVGYPTIPMPVYPPTPPAPAPMPAALATPIGLPRICEPSTSGVAASLAGTSTSRSNRAGSSEASVIELSVMPSKTRKRVAASSEIEEIRVKHHKGRKSEEFGQKELSFSVDDFSTEKEDYQTSLMLVFFSKQRRALKDVADQVRNRLKAEYGDPEFLAKIFAGRSSASTDILKRVESMYCVFLSTDKDVFGKSVSDMANRAGVLENKRTNLKKRFMNKNVATDLDAVKLENLELTRRLAILRDLVIAQRADVADHLKSDLDRTAGDLERLLENLRCNAKKLTEVDPAFKTLTFEALKAIFARILPHEQVDWRSSTGCMGIIKNLRILADAFLSLKNDIERMTGILPRIEQIVADRDSRIVELEAQLSM